MYSRYVTFIIYILLPLEIEFSNSMRAGSVVDEKLEALDEALARGRSISIDQEGRRGGGGRGGRRGGGGRGGKKRRIQRREKGSRAGGRGGVQREERER